MLPWEQIYFRESFGERNLLPRKLPWKHIEIYKLLDSTEASVEVIYFTKAFEFASTVAFVEVKCFHRSFRGSKFASTEASVKVIYFHKFTSTEAS